MGMLLLIPLFLLCSVGPGLLLVRRLRLSGSEKLVTAVGASYLLLYLAAFIVYLLPADRRWHWAITATYTALTALALPDLIRLLRHVQVRRMLLSAALFTAWGLLLLSTIRHYSGGTWSGDWLEHYQRALFFLEHRPPDTLFINLYALPARPPLMNLVAAHFMALAGPGYDVYQLVFLFLNSLAILPCCLIAGLLVRGGARSAPRLLLVLLALSPMIVQNQTYAWTKLFTAFYVLLGIHLYLRSWLKGDSLRMVLAFASLCAGFLVHFSAGPFGLFLGLHYLIAVFRHRRHKWREAAAIGAVSAVILATWFAWSVSVYGARTTFASNTTVDHSTQGPAGSGAAPSGGGVAALGHNLGRTLLPAVVSDPDIMYRDLDLEQPNDLGRNRDFAFLIYQVTFPWALGSAGAILVGVLFVRSVMRPPAAGSTGSGMLGFWGAFVPFIFVLGVAVHSVPDRFGVAHVTLQPLVLLGLTFLAAGLRRLPLGLRWVLVPGLILDFVFGILIHFNVQNQIFEFEQMEDGRYRTVLDDFTLSRAAQANYGFKVYERLTYVGDRLNYDLYLKQALMLIGCVGLLWLGLRAELSGKPKLPPAPAATPARPPDARPATAARRRAKRRRAVGS